MLQSPGISLLGDHAITITLGNTIDETINNKCLALAAHLSASGIKGIKDIIPAYTTVSVIYDPVVIHQVYHTSSPAGFLQQHIRQLINSCNWNFIPETRTITIPACFDTSMAPDLEYMAQSKNISASTLIELFTAMPYRVYLVGFLPGFAYMGKVDDLLAMPRKEKPYMIFAGSIGIAGNQTGIYPLDSPGGWNIIGRTPLKMFDITNDDPCRLHAGDHVTFRAIDRDEFHHLNQNL
jgi:inhibitor of KinA